MPYDSEISTKSRDLIVLEKARERIARGWCQKERVDDAGNVCLRGALAVGRGIEPDWIVLGEQAHLTRLLGFFATNDYCGIWDEAEAMYWNDEEGRTQAQVLARFDEAIERLRAQ